MTAVVSAALWPEMWSIFLLLKNLFQNESIAMNEILDGSSLRVSSLVGRDGVVHQATRSPIRHTSQRTLTDITRRQFWEACRDGDLEQVNYMTAWVKPAEETLSSAFKDTWVCTAGSTINTPTQSERFLQHARYY